MSDEDDILYSPVGTSHNNMISSMTMTSQGSLHDRLLMKIPKRWLDILKKIQSVPGWDEATIAGGALRDLDLGRPVKDIDIFIPETTDARLLIERALNNSNVVEIRHTVGGSTGGNNGGFPIPPHIKFWADGWTFEVTQKTEHFTQRNIIDTFDLGICMITLAYGNICRHPAYSNDVLYQTMTKVNDTGGGERDHAYRLESKYNNWTYKE